MYAAASGGASVTGPRALRFAHTQLDPDLLDLLNGLTNLTGSRQPFQVISGYRSPATNDMLRRHSEGVAAGSLHMKGQAIDIRLADVPLATLRQAALDSPARRCRVLSGVRLRARRHRPSADLVGFAAPVHSSTAELG